MRNFVLLLRVVGGRWLKNVFRHINIYMIYTHKHFFFSGITHDSSTCTSFAKLARWISLCPSLPPSVTSQKQGSCVWFQVMGLYSWRAHKLLFILIKHLRCVSYFHIPQYPQVNPYKCSEISCPLLTTREMNLKHFCSSVTGAILFTYWEEFMGPGW